MLDARFWSKVDKTNSCWNWIAGGRGQGYGCFHINGKTEQSHRLSYEELKGKIPEGLQLDHLCRNRACVNPEHLEAVSHNENTLRGNNFIAQNARKTHCVNGHEFNVVNTYFRKKQKGRDCRLCQRIADSKYRKKIKMEQFLV